MNYCVYFSSRLSSQTPNDISRWEKDSKDKGYSLYQLNDSNPTRHGLQLEGSIFPYIPDPRGPYHARQILADTLKKYSNSCSGFDDYDNADDFVTVNGIKSDRVIDDDKDKTTCISNKRNTDNSKKKIIVEQCAPSAQDLHIVSSTSQAYSWLFKLLCDAGDSILCPTPGYPLITEISALECVHAVPYPLYFEGSSAKGQWRIDFSYIESILKEKTHVNAHPIRALILINPNNPTGNYIKSDEYEKIISLCREYNMALIADEVFFPFVLEGKNPLSCAGEERVLTFQLNGFSKLLASPQIKIGWIYSSGPQDILKEARMRLDTIADTFLPISTVLAQKMPTYLSSIDTQVQKVRQRIERNLQVLHQMTPLCDGLVDVLPIEGGWNVLIRFPSTYEEDELLEELIHVHKITGQPGYFFDMPHNGYLCLSLLPQERVFSEKIRCVFNLIKSRYKN